MMVACTETWENYIDLNSEIYVFKIQVSKFIFLKKSFSKFTHLIWVTTISLDSP
jgi:hypothetical protein